MAWIRASGSWCFLLYDLVYCAGWSYTHECADPSSFCGDGTVALWVHCEGIIIKVPMFILNRNLLRYIRVGRTVEENKMRNM